MARERRTYDLRVELTGGPRLAPVQMVARVARALERELGADRLTAVHAQPGRSGGLEGPQEAAQDADPGHLAAWALKVAEALRDGRPLARRARLDLAEHLELAQRQDELARYRRNLPPEPPPVPEPPSLEGATCYHRVPLTERCRDCQREATGA